MATVELTKNQTYESIFNSLTGTDREKIIHMVENYELYKMISGVDSPFESLLMQTQQENAEFFGRQLTNLIIDICPFTHSNIQNLIEDTTICDTPNLNHMLIGPINTSTFTLTIPLGVSLKII